MDRKRDFEVMAVPPVRDNTVTEPITVAFQGERGAYSEMAVKTYFGKSEIVVVPCPRFRDVFEAVKVGRVTYGMLPIENSLTGSIHENYDLFLSFPDIRICGEQKIRIVHNLIGLPEAAITDITHVYSHPQGLAQCSEFLDGMEPVERVPFYDTAGAVAHIGAVGNRALAAIASREAARVYGMHILQEGIETNPGNFTRFFAVCAKEQPEPETVDKCSFVFSIPNSPGSLLSCLQILADHGINMTKLESRPIHGKPWEYMFYADVTLSGERDAFQAALTIFADHAESVRVLGRYRQ